MNDNRKKESEIEKEFPEDSPLRNLIKIFRTNTVVKHHIQGGGSAKPVGVAKTFFKNSITSFNSSVIPGYTDHQRFARYGDYCEMIAYPIIGKAMQIYADEATQKDENGKIIKVSSDSKEVEDILQDLFDNILQLNGKKIYKIVRDLCKYGDTFYMIDITTNNGVVNLIQMPANEVEREEGFDKEEPTAVRFKWNARMAGSTEIPNAFVAHFRLDGDDMFYPYGTSMLEAARRPWRQLCVSSNTIIWTKTGHKKISEIQIGDEIYSYDFNKNIIKSVKVKNVAKTGMKETYRLSAESFSLDLTEDHQVLVKVTTFDFEDFVYKQAKDIKLNEDKLVCVNDDFSVSFRTALSFEPLSIEDVYDIEIDDNLHNFVANGIVVHNCLLEDAMMIYRITRSAERRAFYVDVMGIPPEDIELSINKFNQELKKNKVINEKGQVDLRYGSTMDMVEDFVIPVRGNDSATRIESLPGGQNIGDIEDIEFIKKNLFSALGIPKAFLTFDEGVGSKQVLTQEDSRFARTISKIQECVIHELVKIALIHLYIRGKRGRDLLNFKIKMTNPSTIAEMQKNELWRTRMDLVQAAGQGVFDTTFIYKNFLFLSDEAIDMIRKGQIQDKIFQAKLMAIENSGGAMPVGGMPGGMGGGMPGMSAPMDMGAGGMPSVDIGGINQGGAPPNITGTPMPESFNPAADVFDNNANGKMKDLSRISGNERVKTKRGQPEEEVITMDDVSNMSDDAFDINGIRRTVESPMGQNESIKMFDSILEGFHLIKNGRNKTIAEYDLGYTVVNASSVGLEKSIEVYLNEFFEHNTTNDQILNEEIDEILSEELNALNEKVQNLLNE